MTRETAIIPFNGHQYKATIQDSHPLNGWLVSITVKADTSDWWLYMGKGRFHIGEIHDWEWSDSFLKNNTLLTPKTPLHYQFKEAVEKAIIMRCMDLLKHD